MVGYDRYSSKGAFETLNRLYVLLRLYVNFFQPVMKLVSKTRNGSKVLKKYDKARTPYQRLVESDVLGESKLQELVATYEGSNPVWLRRQIDATLDHLWSLADSRQRNRDEKQPVVTSVMTQ